MEFHIFNIDQKSDSEIFIYGKLKDDLSIRTIKVKNIISPVYFLPSDSHQDELLNDLKNYTEIEKIEFVKRTNIFHKAFKLSLDMLKVTTNQKKDFSSFDSDFCEFIFTEFNNPVENFIISKNINGPGIIKIENLERNTANITDITFLKNAPFPKLKISSISFELKNNALYKFVYYNSSEKIFVKAIVSNDVDSYMKCKDAKHILQCLIDIIKKDTPDVVLVHNCHFKSKLNIKDKIFCDIFTFAQGIQSGRDFSLQELCSYYKIRKLGNLEGDAIAICDIFESMNALNLAKEMAEISGYLLNKTLNNCRAERIEYTLLHELYSRNYLFPCVDIKNNTKYSGGLVLEPVKGFYEDIVLLLDFNSLYPSIIQEFNVCFSNIGLEDDFTEKSNQNEYIFLPKILSNLVKRRRQVKDLIKYTKVEHERQSFEIRQRALKLTANSIYGCLGSSISRFCNYRMASFITSKGRELLNETKTIAENMNMKVIYGDTDSIMIHTKYPGILKYYGLAIESAQSLVSVINSKYTNIEIELEKVFKKLLLYTKKKYACLVFNPTGSYIETKGLDLVRRDFCLACSDINKTILNILFHDREDYSENTSESLTHKRIKSQECSPSNNEVKENNQNLHVNDTQETVEKIYEACINFYKALRKRPVDDFIISTILSKDLLAYQMTNLPHISLAKRLNLSKNMIFNQDDVISYVIGEGESSISARSFHPDESFNIDYSYYIKNQILPSIFRLISILKYLNTSKISLIFNVKNFIPKEIINTFTILTPCCESVQDVGKNCLKCGKIFSKSFFIEKVHSMIKEAISKCFKYKGECLECGIFYYNHLVKCTQCGNLLKFELNNQEFDDFLYRMEHSFKLLEFPEVNSIIANYSSISSYRIIDLTKYFAPEIELYKKKKNFKSIL